MKSATKSVRTHNCDLVILGSGIAAAAAAGQARRRGWSTQMISLGPGATSLTSGPWDFGVPARRELTFASGMNEETYRQARTRILKDDFEYSMERLRERIDNAQERLAYHFDLERPFSLLNGYGSVRTTYGSQRIHTDVSCRHLEGKEVTVIEIAGLRLGATALVPLWKETLNRLGWKIRFRVEQISLTDAAYDFSAEHLSARLGSDFALRERLTEELRKCSNAEALLLPPISPVSDPPWLKGLEIPAGEWVPAHESAAGLRLQSGIEQWMTAIDVIHHRASEVVAGPVENRMESVVCRIAGEWNRFEAPRFVVATGRMLSGGIEVGYHQVRETLTNLPLFAERGVRVQIRDEIQRSSRLAHRFDGWARLGVWADSRYRPRDEAERILLDNVRLAGSMIGGVDLARETMGLGFSDYTGAECVDAFE